MHVSFDIRIRLPTSEQFPGVQVPSFSEELRESINLNRRFRVTSLSVSYNPGEISVELGTVVELDNCKSLEELEKKLREVSREVIIPVLLAYLYDRYGIKLARARENLDVIIAQREISECESIGGRTLGLSGSITLAASEEIKVISPFRADELAKFIRALVKLSGMDQRSVNRSELRKIDQLVRVLIWYERGTLEIDPIDKFILYWFAVEHFAKFKTPSGCISQRLCATYRDIPACSEIPDCGNTDERELSVYRARNKLFHEGLEDDAVRAVPKLEACLERYVIPEVKRTARQLLTKIIELGYHSKAGDKLT